MIKHTGSLSTVTFDGSQDSEYSYPEIGCYGDDVEVIIQHHHKEDIDASITVKIGNYMLVPDQLEKILNQVSIYKEAAKLFKE